LGVPGVTTATVATPALFHAAEPIFTSLEQLVRRHGQLADALARRVENGIGDGGCDTDDCQFSDALHTKRVDVWVGFYGRWADGVLMRIVDVMLAFPGILLALAIVAVLGPSLPSLMVAVGISTIPTYARLTRGSVLAARGNLYVDAARVVGATDPIILVRHILPNVVAPIIVVATLSVGSAILIAATLSFLGLGSQPPTPEWGRMLSEGRQYLREQWWIATFPGVAIMLTVLALNLLGDGLRDALDPRLKV